MYLFNIFSAHVKYLGNWIQRKQGAGSNACDYGNALLIPRLRTFTTFPYSALKKEHMSIGL